MKEDFSFVSDKNKSEKSSTTVAAKINTISWVSFFSGCGISLCIGAVFQKFYYNLVLSKEIYSILDKVWFGPSWTFWIFPIITIMFIMLMVKQSILNSLK